MDNHIEEISAAGGTSALSAGLAGFVETYWFARLNVPIWISRRTHQGRIVPNGGWVVYATSAKEHYLCNGEFVYKCYDVFDSAEAAFSWARSVRIPQAWIDRYAPKTANNR